MVDMNFPLGFTNNTTSAYATPTKEFACLFSVLAGILICKIVYEATCVVGLSLFKGYAKLSSPQKHEWNNRGFSTFHAFFVAVASIYILFLSDLFKHTSEDDPITYRTSTLSDTALGANKDGENEEESDDEDEEMVELDLVAHGPNWLVGRSGRTRKMKKNLSFLS